MIEFVVQTPTTIELDIEESPQINLGVSIPSPPGPQGPQGPQGPPGADGVGGGTGQDPRVGDLAQLNTIDKDTIVEAINEVNDVGIPFLAIYNNAKAG